MVLNFDPNKDPRYFHDIRKKTYYNIGGSIQSKHKDIQKCRLRFIYSISRMQLHLSLFRFSTGKLHEYIFTVSII